MKYNKDSHKNRGKGNLWKMCGLESSHQVMDVLLENLVVSLVAASSLLPQSLICKHKTEVLGQWDDIQYS